MPAWIDMHYDLDCLTNGDSRTLPQGYWAVIRFMRIGELSVYWNNDTKEAIGGPKWNYDDTIVRVLNRPGMLGKNASGLPKTFLDGAGQDDIHMKLFAVLPMGIPRIPLEEDILYEIVEAASVDAPGPPLHVTSRYKLINVYPVRGDYGRPEVIYLSGSRIHGES